MFQLIICHYGEIGIKGKNRIFFEKKLLNNIELQLKKEAPDSFQSVRIIPGRIVVKLTPKAQIEQLTTALKNVFGIAYFAYALRSDNKIDDLKEKCWQLASTQTFNNFRASATRSDKSYPLTSQQVNEQVGAFIVAKSNKEVKLKDADLNCFIEITNREAFIYSKKITAAGGMPVGASGKALALLSGGIDSPVAAYYALKRGTLISFFHFHSQPHTSPASTEKVIELARILNKFQLKANIYMAPFAHAQEEIMINCPSELRIVLYRRMMLRAAEIFANQNGYLALFTGDSVAQVSSQTLENIKVIEQAAVIPVLRPLIGFDKEEIIAKARSIGTYETSILPHDDCCTRFIPKNPATKASLVAVLAAEQNIDVKKIVDNIINNTISQEIKC